MPSPDAIILYLLGGACAYMAASITAAVATERPTITGWFVSAVFWLIVAFVIRAGTRS